MSNKGIAAVTVVTTVAGETTVISGDGFFYGLVIETNKTDDVAVLVEDGTNKMFNFLCPGTEDGRNYSLAVPVRFTTRLDVTVSGTGGVASVLASK